MTRRSRSLCVRTGTWLSTPTRCQRHRSPTESDSKDSGPNQANMTLPTMNVSFSDFLVGATYDFRP
jgi:hypothetical protein